jgi:hypothetical protein
MDARYLNLYSQALAQSGILTSGEMLMNEPTQGALLLRLAADDAGQFPQLGFRRMWLTPFLILAALASINIDC